MNDEDFYGNNDEFWTDEDEADWNDACDCGCEDGEYDRECIARCDCGCED
jgi:hypothetical protein